jgi:4-hydroxy-tetrahydrodipicolinate synthase
VSDARAIRGILAPHLVPLDARGRIDEDELARYADWLIQRGVHGLYPNGSTGEFVRFTPEERRRIVDVVVAAARGRVPIVAGAAEANVAETLAACEHYARLGVRAVAIVSPFYYKLGPESVHAYYDAIARSSPIDVTLYNIPLFASPIDVETVRRLAADHPRVVGIKDSSGDVAQMTRMIAAVRPLRPDFAFLTGWDPVLMPMLLAGCDGGTHATAAVAPELMRALYESTVAGDMPRAADLQRKVLLLFDAMFGGAEFPEGFRAGLALRGFRTGAGRQPLAPAQRAALDALSQRIATLFEKEGVR